MARRAGLLRTNARNTEVVLRGRLIALEVDGVENPDEEDLELRDVRAVFEVTTVWKGPVAPMIAIFGEAEDTTFLAVIFSRLNAGRAERLGTTSNLGARDTYT